MTLAWLPYTTVDEALSRIGPLPAGIDVDVFAGADAPVPAAVDEVEFIALPNYGGGPAWDVLRTRSLPRLRALQLGSAGYEHMVSLLPAGVSLHNASGVHDAGTAEMALSLILTALRRTDDYARDLPAHRWAPQFSDSLADKRTLILGYGRIGAAVERRLQAFEVASVTRVARRPRIDPVVHPVSALPDLVGDADIVVITAPATPDTIGLFDADMIARMHDGALLVNIGRGAIVDSAALVADGGRIRAALDVVDPEPLPGDHPLWDVPGLVLSPHVGGACQAFFPRYDKLIAAQLNQLATGDPLINQVVEAK